MVHDRIHQSIVEMIGFIHGYLRDIKGIRSIERKNLLIHNQIWKPPNINSIKINVDSSFDVMTYSSISRILARNHMGQIIGSCTYPEVHVADAFIAEARACEQTVRFAIEMGFCQVQIEGDSLTIIKKLNSSDEDKSVFSPINRNIK